MAVNPTTTAELTKQPIRVRKVLWKAGRHPSWWPWKKAADVTTKELADLHATWGANGRPVQLRNDPTHSMLEEALKKMQGLPNKLAELPTERFEILGDAVDPQLSEDGRELSAELVFATQGAHDKFFSMGGGLSPESLRGKDGKWSPFMVVPTPLPKQQLADFNVPETVDLAALYSAWSDIVPKDKSETTKPAATGDQGPAKPDPAIEELRAANATQKTELDELKGQMGRMLSALQGTTTQAHALAALGFDPSAEPAEQITALSSIVGNLQADGARRDTEAKTARAVSRLQVARIEGRISDGMQQGERWQAYALSDTDDNWTGRLEDFEPGTYPTAIISGADGTPPRMLADTSGDDAIITKAEALVGPGDDKAYKTMSDFFDSGPEGLAAMDAYTRRERAEAAAHAAAAR